jgi:hypothetical protein
VWLPTPFYEKAPHYWLLLGLLFIIFGSYLGVQMQAYYIYGGIGIGLGCCAWSYRVFSQRAKYHQAPQPEEYTSHPDSPTEASG